jgi:hypothetical protein
MDDPNMNGFSVTHMPISIKYLAEITEERRQLKEWKQDALTVEKWWNEIDTFVRSHPDATLGRQVSAIALEWLKERDELKRQNARLTAHLAANRERLMDALGW